MELTKQEQEARKRLFLALDVDNFSNALSLVDKLSDLVGGFKIGKQLHTNCANQAYDILRAIDRRMDDPSLFLDLKLHDTPNTVYEAARAGTVPGVYMMDVHVAGGEAMCKKALEGVYDESTERNMERPKVIGVTVLTSLNTEDLQRQGINLTYNELVYKRAELAKEWGLDGIVCPASKSGVMEKEFGSDWLYVTPGIKFGGLQGEGQKQVYTAADAVRDCSNSKLIIGSAITKAPNMRSTTYQMLKSMTPYL